MLSGIAMGSTGNAWELAHAVSSTGPQESHMEANVDRLCPANYTTLLRQFQNPSAQDISTKRWGIVQR
jgi:hypothetical protein